VFDMTNAQSNTSITHAEVFAAARELIAADGRSLGALTVSERAQYMSRARLELAIADGDARTLQRARRRETWELARKRAEVLIGRADRQAVLDVLHDDAKQLDVGRWFATLPACDRLDGCTYPATTDPWDRPPTHAAQCLRGQSIAARWGHL
jgi:hypothetical protein